MATNTTTTAISSDQLYITYLSNINAWSSYYFGLTLPYASLVWNLFTIVVLFFKRRNEKTTMIFFFKWQYVINIIYALNIILLDVNFTQRIFFYSANNNVPDIICKAYNIVSNFIYSLAPWIQVVNT